MCFLICVLLNFTWCILLVNVLNPLGSSVDHDIANNPYHIGIHDYADDGIH